MVTKTVLVICSSLVFIIHILIPKTTAKSSNVNEYMMEDRRTQRRQNYVVQRELDNQLSEKTNALGMPYITDNNLEQTSPAQLPDLMVDYANMIRNDIILLDNSIETRTRKRGNIKVEKHNQAIPEPPCSCEDGKELRDLHEILGEEVYPRYIENRSCNENLCPPPYVCQRNAYNITVLVLRRKGLSISRGLQLAEMPNELKHRWIAVKWPITIGCTCGKDYVQ